MIALAVVYTEDGRKYFVLVPAARDEKDAERQAKDLIEGQGCKVFEAIGYKQNQSKPTVQYYLDEDGKWH